MVDENGYLQSDQSSGSYAGEFIPPTSTAEEEAALLASAFAHCPVGMAFIDSNFVIRAANQRFAEQMRRPFNQMVERPLEEALPGAAQQLKKILEKVRKSGRAFQAEAQPLELQNQPERGVTYWETRVSPRFEIDGSLRGYLALLSEVTGRIQEDKERDRLVEQLRENEERLRLIVSHSPDAMFYQDLDLRYTWVANPMPPFTAERVLGKADFDLFDREFAQELTEVKKAVLESGHGTKCEGPLAIDGSEMYLEMTIEPRRDQDGQMVGLFGYLRDITQRKHADEDRERLLHNLERQQTEMNALLESLTEGVAILDGAGDVRILNAAGRQLLGIPPSGEQTWPLEEYRRLEVHYPDDRPVPFEDWPTSRALRGECFTNYEVLVTRSDKVRKWLSFSGSGIRDDQGKVTLAINVFRDVGFIRDLERQREEFISVVAHDLRGALTVIRGYSDMLARPPVKQGMTSKAERAADAIAIGSRRLSRMIEDLTDISRIEARRLVLQKTEVDVVDTIREVARETAEVAAGHPVRLKVEGKIPSVFADADRLAQILTNLLSNAGKYSYPATEIVVSVKAAAEEVVVSVTNKGPGIPPKELPELFRRFRRVRKVVEEKVEGLGLGLYITKGLVEAHGGHVWAESQPGRETTFSFSLPVGSPK